MSGRQPAAWCPRSALFAPASRAELIAKLPRSTPDAVILDLEDAGPERAKEAARRTLREAGVTLIQDHPQLPVFVRVNALHSGHFERDLELLPPGLAGLVVPKLGSAADAAEVARLAPELPIIAGLETAAGVWNAREIMAHPAVSWAYFGAEDYAADLGAAHGGQCGGALRPLARGPRRPPRRAGHWATAASSASIPLRWPSPTSSSVPPVVRSAARRRC